MTKPSPIFHHKESKDNKYTGTWEKSVYIEALLATRKQRKIIECIRYIFRNNKMQDNVAVIGIVKSVARHSFDFYDAIEDFDNSFPAWHFDFHYRLE